MKGAFNMATIYLKNKVKIYVKKNAEKLIQDIENSSDNLIGMTGLIDLSYRHRRAQFYITIGEMSAWGKGYSKEVIPLVLEFAFIELGLEKVYLFTFDNNGKARTIYEKMGFKQEAFMRKQYFLHGKLNDLFQHSILKEEYVMLYEKGSRIK